VHSHLSGKTFFRYDQNRKICKSKNLKVMGAIQFKGYKQDSQNRPRSPIPERELPSL
jgi:hypothetical protein